MQSSQPNIVLVVNSKGGAGKTTLSTNLAGYFSALGLNVLLKDYDPQCSSSDWVKNRPYSVKAIELCNASQRKANMTFSWQMRLPKGTDVVVIDSPAGVDLGKLQHELKQVSKILVPVIPSPIDLRASALFIRELQKHLQRLNLKCEIGVVASRVNRQNSIYQSMTRIFSNLDIPLVGCLNEAEAYIKSAEHGVGVWEMPDCIDEQLQADWRGIINWLGFSEGLTSQLPRKPELFVV